MKLLSICWLFFACFQAQIANGVSDFQVVPQCFWDSLYAQFPPAGTSIHDSGNAVSQVSHLVDRPAQIVESEAEAQEAEQSLTPYSDALVLCENKPTPLNKSIAAAEASSTSASGSGCARTCPITVSFDQPQNRSVILGVLGSLDGWTSFSEPAAGTLVVDCLPRSRSEILRMLQTVGSDVSHNSQRNPAAAPEYRRSMRAHAKRNSEELVFSQRSFAEVVRCLTMDPDVSPSASSQGDSNQIRFQREALICLQFACEAFLQESFALSQLFASHAKRNTLQVADWKLAQLTSADRQVFANNPSSSSTSSSRPATDRQVANNSSSSSFSSPQPTRATQQGEKRKAESPGPKKPAKRSRS